MCQKCADQSGDPRYGAFQPFYVLQYLNRTDAEKVVQDQPNNGVQTKVFSDIHEAEAELATLEASQQVSQVITDTQIVCLN